MKVSRGLWHDCFGILDKQLLVHRLLIHQCAEEPGDQLQYHLDRLSEEAEKYTASSLDHIQGEEWPWYVLPCATGSGLTDIYSSPGMGELLKAVCQCAVMVYDQTQVIGPKGFDIEPVLHRTPSTLGTVKASSMWKLPFVPIPGWNGKTLVVSVRGTATIADHMVNMNDKPKDAGGLFVSFIPISIALL